MGRFRVLGFVVPALLIAAACGGDSSGEASDVTTSAVEAASSDSTAPADTADETTTSAAESSSGGGALDLVPEGATDILGNPAGQGFVVLDGVRYDFVLTGACRNVFGAVQASGVQAPAGEGKVDALIPPENWESDTDAEWAPPYVEVDLGTEEWRAEQGIEAFVEGESVELAADQSAVTSFTNDGSLVAGTAVFYNEFGFEELETRTGSFEFFCPG